MRPRFLLVAGACASLFLLFAVLGDRPASPAAEPGGAAAGDVPGIVFVGAPIFDEKTDGGQGVYQGSYHWRDSYIYPRSATYNRAERTMGPTRPGRNLYALVPARPDGKLTRLTHLKDGAVFRPEPSFDGKKVLFAMRRDGEDWFHQYEVNVDGTGLRQLTDGPFNDFGGAYLPDGRIVFCSDRTGYLEEYHEERTETLFTMNGDGTNIQQITFLPGTYFEPSVLRDGRILFAYWDPFHIDVPPFDKHETYLATVNPDGTEERHLFGVGQYQFFNRERHSGVGLTQAREMPDGRILCQSEFGPSVIDLRAGLAMRDALLPIFPGTTSIQLGGTTHRVHLSPLGTRSTPYPLADGRFLFAATLPGARDSGIRVADPETRDEEPIFNIPNYAEFDAVPVLVERPRPAVLPSRAKPQAAEGQTTRFLVVAGRNSDNPKRAEALKKARFLRVIEAEYSGVTTSSHTNLETRILGTVPLLPDGSAYFEAPADTPVFLDPLDAGGNRILMDWNYPSTSVAEGLPYSTTQMAYMAGRAGETRSCYGCHAPQTEAVPNVPVMALKFSPARVTREPTDLQYRRNDPDGYRRQARIGDTDLLGHCSLRGRKEVVLRDCEMLMYLEDGAEPYMADLVKLLTSRDVEVRRAAALALTRLATWKEAAVLKAALKDADWQVRHAVEAALEALGTPTKEGTTAVSVFETLGRQEPSAVNRAKVRAELRKEKPDLLALRAAGKLRDPEAIPLLVPWLRKHEWEFHAAEAAVALGRIGTPEAVAALWDAVRGEVPNKKVHISRYLQHGPRPEEYALLRGLYLAGAKPQAGDVHLLIALLPNTFTEKPRFEDRMRDESQRVLLPRALLRKAKLTQPLVAILTAALNGKQKKDDPLYEQLLKGINLERPFSEHGRPFPVVKEIGTEEALWLLGCLFNTDPPPLDTPVYPIAEEKVVACLTSANHRERIDAAVLLGRVGISPKAAAALAAEIAKPYAFGEIWSMGKGMPDDNFRDKAYMMLTLARHAADVKQLRRFADPKKMTRDVRYALARGLAKRYGDDAIPLLAEMAMRDPITLIRQQARYGIEDIQFRTRLGGNKPPAVAWPEPLPLEALYPPRGLQWADTTFVEFNREPAADSDMDKLLIPVHFKNLNNAQAKGAQLMMIDRIEETRRAFDRLDRKDLEAALDRPFPFVHYLAAHALGERGGAEAVPALLRKAEEYAKVQETVGLWWCCEALGQLKAKEALPLLVKFTATANPVNVWGPEGLPIGYVAARNLARIAADPEQADVARLLKSDNLWLRAAALRGLAEADAPGIDKLLRAATAPEEPAVVRHEAEVQRARRGRDR